MKINWKARIKNKVFWVAIIPALLVLAKHVLEMFGITFDVTGIQADLLNLVDSVFMILGLLGIVIDPTTKGASDSEQAQAYTEPK